MVSIKAIVLAGVFLLLAPHLAQADPPFNPPGPPSWVTTGPPSWVTNGRSVPIPATDLLFGLGFIALPWLRSRIQNKK